MTTNTILNYSTLYIFNNKVLFPQVKFSGKKFHLTNNYCLTNNLCGEIIANQNLINCIIIDTSSYASNHKTKSLVVQYI